MRIHPEPTCALARRPAAHREDETGQQHGNRLSILPRQSKNHPLPHGERSCNACRCTDRTKTEHSGVREKRGTLLLSRRHLRIRHICICTSRLRRGRRLLLTRGSHVTSSHHRERGSLARSGSLRSFRLCIRRVLADFYDDFSSSSGEQRMSTMSNLRACRSKTWESVARQPERARRPRSRQSAPTVPVVRRHPEQQGCPRSWWKSATITSRNCSMLNDPIDD